MEALVSDCASAIQRLGLISCDSTILQLGAQFGLGAETFEGITGVDQPLSTHCPISCQICDGNITMWIIFIIYAGKDLDFFQHFFSDVTQK